MATKTILLVEDDSSNAEALTLLLQLSAPYQIIRFSDGAEALAHLETIKAQRPALFLLDYRLPIMSTRDLYARLQATEGLEQVPAIILSGGSMSDQDQTYFSQHGLLFMAKPYDIDQLLETIHRLID